MKAERARELRRETIENRMVVDSKWPAYPEEVPEKLNGPGYREMFTGVFVAEEDAFDYAMERCVLFAPEGFRKIYWTQEFKNMLWNGFSRIIGFGRIDGTD